MNKLSQAAIDKLTSSEGEKVISIYLPTHRQPTPPHMSEDQTRFKNMIQQARGLVEEDNQHDSSLLENLDQLEKKIDDVDFWHGTTEALAIFVSAKGAEIYHLPIECEEHVSYSDSFMMAPLIMVESLNQKFYTLSLALKGSKFYVGDMYGMEEVAISLPESVEDALNIDEMFANSKTQRSHQAGGAGGPNAQTPPHGEGDSSDAGSQERLQYFKIIEQAIRSHKDFDEKFPLVVAGTESEANDFCSHTSLSNIIPSILKGNYSHLGHNELHDLVWPLIREDVIHRQEQEIADQVGELQGAQKASTQLSDIESAAKDGRVDKLLVPMIDQTHDSVTDSTEAAPVLRLNGDDSGRLKRLVHLVNQFGGQVYGVDDEVMPSGAKVAAVYRY